MTKKNQKSSLNYSRHTWCLDECNKINTVGSRSVNRKLQFLALSRLIVSATPDPFINLLKLIVMQKQSESNVVYDSANDKNWNMQGFFEALELYYEGKPELMAEDLVQTIKTLLLGSNDIISDAVIEASLHLFYIREAVQGIEVNN